MRGSYTILNQFLCLNKNITLNFDCKDCDRIRTFKTRHEDICTEGQDLANPNTKRKVFISDTSIRIEF